MASPETEPSKAVFKLALSAQSNEPAASAVAESAAAEQKCCGQ
jgi:hypothetical protein